MLGGIAQGIGYALTEGFAYRDCYPEKLNFRELNKNPKLC
jgi:CO/xanthine dehydrogenase Mo-binding subunit